MSGRTGLSSSELVELSKEQQTELVRKFHDDAVASELALETPQDFESSTGIGVRGRVGARALAIGNTQLMSEQGVDPASLQKQAEMLRNEGASVMYLAVDGALAGLIAVADPIKASSREAIKAPSRLDQVY